MAFIVIKRRKFVPDVCTCWSLPKHINTVNIGYCKIRVLLCISLRANTDTSFLITHFTSAPLIPDWGGGKVFRKAQEQLWPNAVHVITKDFYWIRTLGPAGYKPTVL